ncbi:UNVERIFIED_ORG: fucose 4-O-acetylase-like acetyltransferase [Xanthobacter viscosus]|jgi:fucose 4-O-acetylase-like acetyltransferase|uniref:Acyltransferase n=1 Tax=Xanthobacter autotrophicus TaxID=280 RepID=A0A6C1KT33_XANAU|nr:acyltransferase [Xanthobacter autotrophicus]TLX41983.1 acyltransferase [Xanthobacter autotrophicus]
MTAAAPTRFHWIDYAKAIGILLVVFGHVLIGMRFSAFTQFPSWMTAAEFYIYSFHMPLFFLLSGYVFPISKEKKFGHFLVSSLINLFIPYLIWNVVFALLKNLSFGSVHVAVPLNDIPKVILHPIQHFWFLPYLFMIRFLYWFAERIDGMRGLGVFAACTAAWYMIYSTFGLQDAVDPRFYMGLAFFGLGTLLERSSDVLAALRRGGALAACVLAWAALATVCYLFGFGLFVPLAAIAGVAAVVSLALLLPAPTTPWSRALGFLGEASLGIYITHGIFMALTRTVLLKVYVSSVGVHIILGTMAAVICPIILVIVANKLAVSPFIGLGRNWSSRYLRGHAFRDTQPLARPGNN